MRSSIPVGPTEESAGPIRVEPQPVEPQPVDLPKDLPPPAVTQPARAENSPAPASHTEDQSLWSQQDQRTLAKVEKHLEWCTNISQSIHESYRYYFGWVPRNRPFAAPKTIYGINEISDPEYCLKKMEEARTTDPPLAIEEVVQSYINAIKAAQHANRNAHLYYKRQDYLDDDFARAKILHSELIKAYEDFAKLDGLFLQPLNQLRAQLRKRDLQALEQQGPSLELSKKQSLLVAEDIIALAKLANTDRDAVDLIKLQALVKRYQALIDEIEDYQRKLGKGHLEFLKHSNNFLLGAKMFARSYTGQTAEPTQMPIPPSVDGSYYGLSTIYKYWFSRAWNTEVSG